MPYMGKANVVFTDPNDTEDQDNYTVPIPEGLEKNFNPSQPITKRQWLDYETKGVEPYPGFADELMEWEKAWDRVNREQLKADGADPLVLDMVHPDPEFDDEDNPIEYSDMEVEIDKDSGEAKLRVSEAEMTQSELNSNGDND